MNEYVEKVLSGEIVANIKITQACKRHIEDIEKSKDKDFPYIFDEKQSKKAIDFIELMPSTSGDEIKMLGFQKFIIGSLYGWRTKEDDFRRFNRAYISMARKNGKTYLVSGIGANALIMEKEPAQGRQILFTANSHKQASLGYNMLSSSLKAISKKSKFMRQQLKIMNSKIEHTASNSFAMALASETSTLDGFNPCIAIRDEAHESKTRKVENVLKSGMSQQKNGLLATISTAGLNMNVPLYDDYQFLSDVLAGKSEAERYFIAIWELDSPEEIHNQDMWIKANPIFELEELKKVMLPTIKDDIDLALKQNNINSVLVKSFNLWRQASEDSYIAGEDWEATEIKEVLDIKGKDVYVGVDLSKTNDLTSLSWIVPLDDERLLVDSHSFVGTKYGLQDKIKRDGIDYIEREKQGECTITSLESGIIDYEEVFEWLVDFIQVNNLNVVAICYDPWNANSLISKFEKENYPLIEVRQGAMTLNTPTRTFREQLYDKQIIHPFNKLLTHAVNNAILKEDNNGVQINKTKNANKIDPIVSLMNAYTQAMYHFEAVEGKKANNEFYQSEEFSF